MKATEFHKAVQKQLRRVKVAPGKSPKETAANLKALVDTIIELSKRPAPAPRPPKPRPAPAPVIEDPGFDIVDEVAEPETQDEPVTTNDEPGDWRATLGFAPGSIVSPIQLKAAFMANLNKSGALFAYNLGKLELGIP